MKGGEKGKPEKEALRKEWRKIEEGKEARGHQREEDLVYETCVACGTEKPIRPHLICCALPTLLPTARGKRNLRMGRKTERDRGRFRGERSSEDRERFRGERR